MKLQSLVITAATLLVTPSVQAIMAKDIVADLNRATELVSRSNELAKAINSRSSSSEAALGLYNAAGSMRFATDRIQAAFDDSYKKQDQDEDEDEDVDGICEAIDQFVQGQQKIVKTIIERQNEISRSLFGLPFVPAFYFLDTEAQDLANSTDNTSCQDKVKDSVQQLAETISDALGEFSG